MKKENFEYSIITDKESKKNKYIDKITIVDLKYKNKGNGYLVEVKSSDGSFDEYKPDLYNVEIFLKEEYGLKIVYKTKNVQQLKILKNGVGIDCFGQKHSIFIDKVFDNKKEFAGYILLIENENHSIQEFTHYEENLHYLLYRSKIEKIEW